jgi:hypothetical protein
LPHEDDPIIVPGPEWFGAAGGGCPFTLNQDSNSLRWHFFPRIMPVLFVLFGIAGGNDGKGLAAQVWRASHALSRGGWGGLGRQRWQAGRRHDRRAWGRRSRHRRLLRREISPARGPPTDWGELVQAHDVREAVQVSPDELPVIDIHSL